MANKVTSVINQSQKDFLRVFSDLCYSKSDWQVWTDFIYCAATAIANSVDREGPVHDAREERCMTVLNGYRESERAQFPDLLEILVNALEQNPDQDFLGEMFMVMKLGSHWHGQFFTPYSVCRMMARMQITSSEKELKARGWVGVNDPACGAGALLIAARNEFAGHGIGWMQTFFVAQDIDQTAALMCYIQLSLLGCAGYVVIADTLCNPLTGPSILTPVQREGQEFWFMPMTADPVWQGRAQLERFRRTPGTARMEPQEPEPQVAEADFPEAPQDTLHIDAPEPEPVANPIPKAPAYDADENGQLSFFLR